MRQRIEQTKPASGRDKLLGDGLGPHMYQAAVLLPREFDNTAPFGKNFDGLGVVDQRACLGSRIVFQ